MRKNKNPNKIFIMPNLQLLVMGIILLVLIILPTLVIMIIEDEPVVTYVFGFLDLAFIAAILYSSPKYTLQIMIDLENQTVTRKAWFTKTVVKHISEYKYVYDADYYHYGIRPKYIIIATEPVEEIYLTNVNNLPLSENAIAMEYTKERWDIVQRICNKI
jgi:hypothetical protein